jgi:hypothetical protein
MEQEGQGQIHGRTGLWLDPQFPTTGWRFVEMEEGVEADRLCGACRNARERYVHRLKHVPTGLTIVVGRPCAERLEDDPYGPGKRERTFRDDLRIIKGWDTRKWRISQQGNPYINSRGYNVTIWPKGPGFGITLNTQNKFGKDDLRHGKKLFGTIEDAKRGALEAVMFARKKSRE